MNIVILLNNIKSNITILYPNRLIHLIYKSKHVHLYSNRIRTYNIRWRPNRYIKIKEMPLLDKSTKTKKDIYRIYTKANGQSMI